MIESLPPIFDAMAERTARYPGLTAVSVWSAVHDGEPGFVFLVLEPPAGDKAQRARIISDSLGLGMRVSMPAEYRPGVIAVSPLTAQIAGSTRIKRAHAVPITDILMTSAPAKVACLPSGARFTITLHDTANADDYVSGRPPFQQRALPPSVRRETRRRLGA